MSHIANIDINYTPIDISFGKIIRSFLSFGWSMNDNGAISYLPISDNGVFDWDRAPLSDIERIFEVIEKKGKAREIVGVALTWSNSHIGGELFWHEPA